MTTREHSTAWAETALRYLDALDSGDVTILAELWEQAALNPELEQLLNELTDGLAIEEGPASSWETEAALVRTLLREHLPSAFPAEMEPPPLTVGDVAAKLQADSTLGGRLSATDRAANERLLVNATLVPQELGLPHFERWRTTLSVSASKHYWRTFQQTAVLLAMGRCQQAVELAAARRAGSAREEDGHEADRRLRSRRRRDDAALRGCRSALAASREPCSHAGSPGYPDPHL